MHKPTKLGSVLFQVHGLGEMSITTLIDEHVDYRLLTINLQTHVTWGKATVTAECDTVNVGDFVLYNDRAGSPVSPPDSVFFSTCAVL